MTVAKLERLTCDRCGEQDILNDDPYEPRLTQWARIVAATRYDTRLIGDEHAPADLCSQCTASLIEWFKRDELVAQAGRVD